MDCVVTPLKTLMSFSVYLNVQLKFYNLPFINIRHEDYATWLQILRKSDEKAWLFPEITAKYRVRDDSISSNKLKSLSWTWNVYRNSEHLSLIKSAYYLGCNALHGLLKHQQIFKSV